MSKITKLTADKNNTKSVSSGSRLPQVNAHQLAPTSCQRELLRLRSVGNFTSQQAFALGIQTKLQLGQANDKYEQEADKVADRITAMPDSQTVNRHAGAEDYLIQAKNNTNSALAVPPGTASDIHSIEGAGRSLPASERTYFEPRFGRDLSSVRIHTNKRAAEISQSIKARAFTYGNNLVFGAGQYAPGTSPGKKLLAHELTHYVQQSGGSKINHADKGTTSTNSEKYNVNPVQHGATVPVVQRDLPADIRTEAALPGSQQTQGRLGQLETQARSSADAVLQQLTGSAALPAGATGIATQIINHIAGQISQLENARARGYQQAVSAIIGQQALNNAQASSFWLAFAGNTLWALSGLVPLLGPTIGISRIALAAGGGALLRANVIGRFLQLKGGAIATAVVGLAGAEMAQFSGGLPSGSALPRNLQSIQTQFTNVNSRVMTRYRSEAFALTLEFLSNFSNFWQPGQINQQVTANFLENFTKGSVMETLFADLNAQGALNISNYTVNTGRAQSAAKNNLLEAFILRFGTVSDVPFTTTHDIADRVGAIGSSAALRALGGQAAFARGLQGNYALVLGNVNGVLADWGAISTQPIAAQNTWSSGNILATGNHSVNFRIVDRAIFAAQLNRNNYTPITRGVRTIRSMHRRGARWPYNVLPTTGIAKFSSSNYRSVVTGGRTVYGLSELTLKFSPLGRFRSTLSERSTIEPGTHGQIAVYSFSGNAEKINVIISRNVVF